MRMARTRTDIFCTSLRYRTMPRAKRFRSSLRNILRRMRTSTSTSLGRYKFAASRTASRGNSAEYVLWNSKRRTICWRALNCIDRCLRLGMAAGPSTLSLRRTEEKTVR
eukprot:Rmarinus@m.15663